MTIQCTGCHTRYLLADDQLPDQGLRVRCPKCRTVFRIYRARVEEPEEMVPAGDAAFERSETVFASDTGGGAARRAAPEVRASAPEGAWQEEKPGPAARPAPGPTAGEPAGGVPKTNTRVIDLDAPAEEKAGSAPEAPAAATVASPDLEKEKQRARRLAKVLVSDILIYNREKRDEALKEGKLMAVLGAEIKKSWETYKEKVSPEVANSTSYFKDALNEILADGQKVF
jgi:predicted Zn finger-like uncharacterized protein